MFGEIIIFTIASTIILFSFIGIGVSKFGILESYSGYAPKWDKAVPIKNMNLWSIVTLVAAFLICPVMLELATGSVWQFLGFLTPVYLVVVALTPKFSTDRKQFIIHLVASILCFIGGLCWVLFIMKSVMIFIISLIFILALSLFTDTFRKSVIFWLEMVMFLSVYLTVLMVIL